MSALHQMGHDTKNLIPALSGFVGAIASPVNDSPEDVARQISQYQKKAFSFILDPQLYFPQSQRGQLRAWGYFPADFETADMSSYDWWAELGAGVLGAAKEVGAREVCSPICVPKSFDDEYYEMFSTVAGALSPPKGLQVLQTVLVRMEDLAKPSRPLEIASVVTAGKCSRAYLVLSGQLAPRSEMRDIPELKGAMRLIAALTGAGIEVTVPFCGAEAALWKVAGAQRVATGKFLNLRRFTPGRFEDPNRGGGQVPYWFEENLMALIRQYDVIRLEKLGLLSEASQNAFGLEILAQLADDQSKSWIGLGWRQNMQWFADFEERISDGLDLASILESAENNWRTLRQGKILLEEAQNDGAWVRSWRIALSEFGEQD